MLPDKRNIIYIFLTLIVFGAVFLWWIFKNQPLPVSERIPGMDERPKMAARSDTVNIGEFFDTLSQWMHWCLVTGLVSGELILII